jgi:hypothetical protein
MVMKGPVEVLTKFPNGDLSVHDRWKPSGVMNTTIQAHVPLEVGTIRVIANAFNPCLTVLTETGVPSVQSLTRFSKVIWPVVRGVSVYMVNTCWRLCSMVKKPNYPVS